MKWTAFFIIMLLLAASTALARTPVWEDTELNDLTENRIRKEVNNGSIFVDEENYLHAVYLQVRPEGAVTDRVLHYSFRDSRNQWSEPERIAEAGFRFNHPNVLVNPRTDDIEIYGDIDGALHRLVREEENEWSRQRIETGDWQVKFTNLALDSEGNIHMAGVTPSFNEQNKIVYITNYHGDWEHFVIEETQPFHSPAMVKAVISTNNEGRAAIGYLGAEGVRVVRNRAPGQDVWSDELIDTPNPNDGFFDLTVKDEDIHLIIAGNQMWGAPFQQYYLTCRIGDERWSEPQLINRDHSISNPTLVVDLNNHIHVVGTVISGNLFTGEMNYITNAGGNWEVSNPFEDYRWGYPFLELDITGNFQMIVIRSEDVGNNDFIHETAHLGAPWEPLLPVPQNLQADIEDMNITLKWDEIHFLPPAPDFLGYNIYRQGTDDETPQLINEEVVTDTTYIDSEPAPGMYDYFVSAVFEEDESELSEPVTIAALPLPRQLSANVQDYNVDLTWQEPAMLDHPLMPELLGYNIYGKEAEEPQFQRINEHIVPDTTFTHSGLQPAKYDYYITALYEDEIESKPSQTINVLVKEKLPKPVFNPEPGKYDHVLNVSIICPEDKGTIHFTIDGSEPTTESNIFKELMIITETTLIKARSFHPERQPSDIAEAKYIIEMVSTDDVTAEPIRTKLLAAYPNPFNPQTVIPFNIGEHTNVSIDIFNVKGEKVRTLVDEKFSPGNYSVAWDGKDQHNIRQPSGIYYYRLKTASETFVRNVALLK